ncbi:MAG: hypothetical protein QOJ03_1758 [Frankiaceae bacterium]|nr:hypothetical protein [Frankiaceae bacterium]
MASAVAVVALAAPAVALTEARIIDVSCHGMRIVQTGLPPRAEFTVEALNAADGQVLAERRVRSSARGRLDVTFRISLRGVHRLHGEVSKRSGEYGEADVSLDARCRVTGTGPPPEPPLTQPTSTAPAAGSPDAGTGGIPAWGWAAGGGGLAALAVLVTVAVTRRSRENMSE